MHTITHLELRTGRGYAALYQKGNFVDGWSGLDSRTVVKMTLAALKKHGIEEAILVEESVPLSPEEAIELFRDLGLSVTHVP